ncbi:MAG: CDP-alcohol phosphatidyltransferase family protein [Phycisphaerales bacterium]
MPTPFQRQFPNSLTVLRLVLAVAFFALLGAYQYPDGPSTLLNVATAVFILAAITDSLDGMLARRWEVVSAFGRIMDPVADKVLVIGAFVFLCGPRFLVPPDTPVAGGLDSLVTAVDSRRLITGLYPWMVVVIIARELLVTSIRGMLEGIGVEFGAVGAGKLKMVLQSVATPAILLLVANADPTDLAWAAWTRDALVYLMIFFTVISGAPYVTRAWAVLRRGQATS